MLQKVEKGFEFEGIKFIVYNNILYTLPFVDTANRKRAFKECKFIKNQRLTYTRIKGQMLSVNKIKGMLEQVDWLVEIPDEYINKI